MSLWEVDAAFEPYAGAPRRNGMVLLWRGVADFGGEKDFSGTSYTAESLLADLMDERGGYGMWWGDEKEARFYGAAERTPYPSGGGYNDAVGMVIAAWWPEDILGDPEAVIEYGHEGLLVPRGTQGVIEKVEVFTNGGWKTLPAKGMSVTASAGVIYRGIALEIDNLGGFEDNSALRYYTALDKGDIQGAASILLNLRNPDRDGLGMHWSFSKEVAMRFARISSEQTIGISDSTYLFVPVIFEATYNSDQVEYDPDVLADAMTQDVGGTSREEMEVLLRPGATINIQAIDLPVPRDTEWARVALEEGGQSLSLPFEWRHVQISTTKTAGASEVKVGETPLDYPYGGNAVRFYIEDPSFEGDPGDTYHHDPGVVSFLDLFEQGPDRVFIAYMHTSRKHGGKGYARRLVQEVYDRYYDGNRLIDWGEVMDEHAGTLVEKFAEKYPNTKYKMRW